MIIEDIVPRTNIEWLWTLDPIGLSWEILCNHCLREKTLQIYWQRDRFSLATIGRCGNASGTRSMVPAHCERAANEWCEDQDIASKIERRPSRNGFDNAAVNAEVFAQAQDAFGLFDQLMQLTQRIMLRREIAISRKCDKRAGKSKIANRRE